MALPLRPLSVHGAPFSVPVYLRLDLGKRMLRNIAHFCLHAHTLRVEASLRQEHTSACNRCDQGGLKMKSMPCSFVLAILVTYFESLPVDSFSKIPTKSEIVKP
eukprot:716952-Pelagomonas_calceolata.AAC.4